MSYLQFLFIFFVLQWIALPALAIVAEDEEKAKHLINFYSMGEWPPQRTREVFSICTLGHERMNTALQRWERQNRNLHQLFKFPSLYTLEFIRGCHILVIGEKEESRQKMILNELGDSPVLTATDSPKITDTMVVFYMEGNKLVFSINQQRMERAKIRFNPNLLDEATLNKK